MAGQGLNPLSLGGSENVGAETSQSSTTDDLVLGGGGGYLKNRAMVLDTGVTYSSLATAVENTPTDGTVIVGEGTFDNLTETSTLHGQSPTVTGGFPDGLTVTGSGYGTLIDGGADDAIRHNGSDHVTFENMRLTTDVTGSTSDAYHGVWSRDGHESVFRNLWAVDCNYGGLEVGPPNDPAESRRIKFENCMVIGESNQHGLGNTDGNEEVVWDSIIVYNVNGSAIDAEGHQSISNVYAHSVSGRGAGVFNVTSTDDEKGLTECVARDCGSTGNPDFHLENATAVNCRSINSSYTSFRLDGASTIIAPRSIDASANGVTLDSGNHNTVRDPYIRNAGAWGIRDSGATDTRIYNKDVSGSGNGPLSDSGTRTVEDNRFVTPPTLILSGNGRLEPVAAPVNPYIVYVDAGGSARNIDGIRGDLNIEGQQIVVKRVGGENLTFEDDEIASDELKNQSGSDVTLDAADEIIAYQYDGAVWREMWQNVQA